MTFNWWLKFIPFFGADRKTRRMARRRAAMRRTSRLHFLVLEDRLTPAFNLLLSLNATVGVTSATAAGTTTFTANASSANLSWSDVDNALVGGNDVVITSGAAGTEAGNITDLTGGQLAGAAANHTLTLQSGTGTGLVGNITIQDITIAGTNESIVVSANGSVATGALSAGTIATPAALTGATITATTGSVTEGGTVTGPIFATNLAVSAATGIGATATPLPTQASNLVARSGTGGIFVSNTGALNIGFTADPFQGVTVTGASGDISLAASGTVTVATNGEIVRGPGNVTVSATGATSDVHTGGSNVGGTGSISTSSAGQLVTIHADRALTLGDATTGFGDIRSNGSILLTTTTGDITLDQDTLVIVDAGTGAVTATAGGNITMLLNGAAVGPRFATAGGAISLTTGPGGTFTANSAGTNAVVSAGGAITISADDMVIAKGINAGAGTVTLRQAGTTARAIDLGLGTTAGTLGLSAAELNQVTAGSLTIGRADNSGNITLTAPINPTGTSTLTLTTAGSIVEGTPGLAADITVGTLNVNAGSAIGSASGNGSLRVSATTLNVHRTSPAAGINVFLSESATSVAIGQIDAGTGNVTLASSGGPITGISPNDGVAEVIGNTVTLTVTATSNGNTGQIGFFTTSAQFFEVAATTLNASTNNSRLWISALGGTALGGVNAGTNAAFLRTVNGTLTSTHTGATPDVTAAAVNLSLSPTATSGAFGTSAQSLLTQTSALTASVPVGLGSINVTNVAAGGNLSVTSATTAGGAINLSVTGGNLTTTATTGTDISAPGGTVTLNTSGAVVSGTAAGVTDVAAANLAITAGAGIGSTANPLKTAVANLAFSNAAGFINVTNTGALTVNAVGALATSSNTGVSTTLIASSPVTFAVNTTSAGTLTAMATDSAATGDDLTVNPGVTVRSTGGNVILQAGDNLTLGAGSLVQAFGTISLAVDFGNADPTIGGIATFAGASLNAPGGATLTGDSDNDTFNFSPSATTAISVNGGLGTDTLNFNALNNPVTVTSTTLTAGALQPVTYANIESINLANNTSTLINGTVGADAFVLSNGPSGPQVTLNGGPAIAVGNAPLTLDGLTGVNSVVIDFSNGNPIPAGGVTFLNITAFTVDGTAGNDTFILQQSAGVNQFSVNGGPFINLPGANSYQFNGLAGNDTMRVLYAGGDPVPAGGVTFDGGPGSDQLGVDGGNTGVSAIYTPSATTPGNGTVAVNGHTITFQNLAPLDISGMATATVTFPNPGDVVTVQDGFDFTAGGVTPALRVSGTTGGIAFETVALFNNTTVNLDTTPGNGNDTVTVASADNAHNNTNINITTGVGTDVVTTNGPVSLAGTFTVTSQTINVNAPITSTGAAGGVTLTNSGTLTIDNTSINSQGNVTQNGAGGVTLTGNVAISTNAGAIAFQSPINAGAGTNQFTSTGGGAVSFASTYNGPADVTVNTSGQTTFTGAIGGATSLSSLTTDAPGSTAINGGTVITTGAQTYNDDVTVGAAATQFTSTGNGAISFNSTLNGASAVTVTTAGLTMFGGAVGGITPLTSLATNGGGTTAVNGASVTTTGQQDYSDGVTVAGQNTLFQSSGNALIQFRSTLDGPSNVSVTTGGLTVFGTAGVGAVGGITPLASLTTDAAGTTDINSGSVTTTGDQNYNDDVTLTADTTLNGANVRFSKTVNSDAAATPRILIVNAAGATVFGGAVGTTFALASLTTDAPGNTAVNGGAVITTGAQTYNDPVTVGAAATQFTSTGNAGITFASTLDGASAVTVNTTGQTTFGGAVGSITPLISLTTNAGGSTAVNGSSVITTGAQTYNDAVTVGGPTTQFTSTGNADILFGSTLDGASAVTVTTGGTTTFTGAVGGTTPLTSLATNGGGTTVIQGGLVSTTAAQNFSDAVTVGPLATLFTSVAGPITFGNTVNGNVAVTVTTPGLTTFAGAVGNTTPLVSLTTNGGGVTAINGAAVTTSDFQTYNDDVTLGAAAAVTTVDTTANGATTGGNLTFGGKLDGTGAAGSQCLAIRAGTTGDVSFTGAVGSGVALGDLVVQSARNVTFASTLTAADFRQATGNGTTRFNGTATVSAAVGMDVTTQGIILNANVTATNAAGAIRLNPLANGVSQTAGSLIVQNLLLNGTGLFTITDSGNNVAILAADVTGPLAYQDINALTVGQVTVAAVNLCGVPTTGGAANGVNTNNNSALIVAGGALQFAGPLTTGTGVARLQAASIGQAAAGTITAASLGVRATGGNIELDQANVVPVFAAQNTFANGSINFRTTGQLTLDQVTASSPLFAAVAGVVTTGTASIVRLQAVNGVNQTVAGLVNTGSLGVRNTATGDIALLTATNYTANTGNQVGTFAAFNGAAGGRVDLASLGTLSVGTVAADGTFALTRGITTNNGGSNLRSGTNFTAVDTNFADPLIKLGTGDFVVNPGQTPVPAAQINTVVRIVTFNAEITARRAFFGVPAAGDVPVEQPNNTPPLTPANPFRESFSIRPSSLITDSIYVNGNLPNTLPGDTLTLLLSGLEQGLVFTPGTKPGSGTITFTNRRTVAFTGIESLPQLSIAAFAYLDQNNVSQFIIQGQFGGLNSGQPFPLLPPTTNPFIVAPAGVNPVAPIRAPTLAVGDVNGDGIPDLVIASGSGSLPLVTIVNGQKLFGFQQGITVKLNAADLIAQFFAYDPNFLGGIFVATGDLNGDGKSEVITGAGEGGGPHVKSFTFNPAAPSGNNIQQMAGPLGSFFAYDPTFVGGVRVASADVNGDGKADIVTGAGPGGGPHVKVFDGATGGTIRSFFAYDVGFAGGVFVAAGDYDRDGKADILTGAGYGGGPHVKVFSGATNQTIVSFLAFPMGALTPFGVGPDFFTGVGGVSFFINDTGIGLPNEILVTSGVGRPLLALVFRGTMGNPVPVQSAVLVDAVNNIPNDRVHNLIGGLIPGVTPGLP